MKFSFYLFMQKRLSLFISLFLLSTLLILSSCTTGPHGKLQWSDEALNSFESSQILENHTYYFYGPEMKPDAIIAVDNQFVLADSFWKKIDLTSTHLARWMERIDNQHRFRDNKYLGAVIVDEDGNRIGLWYSPIDWTVIKRGEGNEVIIHTPDTARLHREGGGRRDAPRPR